MNISYVGNNIFQIEENELLSLLIASAKLEAIECGGVDNWSGYSESIDYFLEESGVSDFDELAQQELDKLK